MHTAGPCAVEALCAGAIPVRGVIAPTEFIPIAEESGMIQALGGRVCATRAARSSSGIGRAR
jgi:EAL domain-containing protein (putative c-di-GMP-specific phosphodiesterase class I)